MSNKVDSTMVLKRLRYIWMAIGMDWSAEYAHLAVYWQPLATLVGAIWFPLHLNIGLLQSKSQAEIFENLVMNVASVSNSLKHFLFRHKRKQMRELINCFAQLDKRVQHPLECEYLQKSMVKTSLRMLNIFAISYYAVTLTSLIGLVMGGKRMLVYPGWIPFDWNASIYHYLGAVSVQYIGLILGTTMNLFNDAYGPLLLCNFAGHVHLLQLRIARIGNDSSATNHAHAQELKNCIRDYQTLMRSYKTIEDTLSLALFTQFIASSINICGAVIYIIFFASNIYSTAYFCVHLTAIALQLLPVCYYGSVLQLKFAELTYAIFNCNWLEQPRSFRSNMIILTDLTMRDVTPYAAGMVRIHLDSYFATCKMAYSLVTLIMSMK